ncbi:unnamed protein product [Allacma fusca]|uniref:Uncharacterized protein n=1 Tax=Allacma fusca TaxID=39272 RepID=A0A8J2LV06_9HEXA|nr:unnamed protein product [Allacma fusca]
MALKILLVRMLAVENRSCPKWDGGGGCVGKRRRERLTEQVRSSAGWIVHSTSPSISSVVLISFTQKSHASDFYGK